METHRLRPTGCSTKNSLEDTCSINILEKNPIKLDFTQYISNAEIPDCKGYSLCIWVPQ